MPSQKQQNTLGFYVIFSEDPFLAADACEKLLDSVLGTEEDRGLALYEPKADEANIADVLDELRTLPFLSSRRVVLIKDAGLFVKANSDALEAYLDHPSPSGVLILTVGSWDKRTRLHKKLQKTKGLIEIKRLYSNQLPGYAASYARQSHDLRLDGQAARLLVELTGDDPGRLCREIDKLAAFVSPRKTISLDDIESLIGHNRMFDAFGVIDAITAGRVGPAISRIRAMFEADKSTEYSVVGAFAYHFRRLFQAKARITRGLSPQEAALKSGVRFKQAEFLQQAARLSLQQLSWIMAELGRIDFGLKRGQTTAPVAMERLILKIFEMQE